MGIGNKMIKDKTTNNESVVLILRDKNGKIKTVKQTR